MRSSLPLVPPFWTRSSRLADHAEEVTLIGAQTISLHTGAADVALAETTKDSDLVLDPVTWPTTRSSRRS